VLPGGRAVPEWAVRRRSVCARSHAMRHDLLPAQHLLQPRWELRPELPAGRDRLRPGMLPAE